MEIACYCRHMTLRVCLLISAHFGPSKDSCFILSHHGSDLTVRKRKHIPYIHEGRKIPNPNKNRKWNSLLSLVGIAGKQFQDSYFSHDFKAHSLNIICSHLAYICVLWNLQRGQRKATVCSKDISSDKKNNNNNIVPNEFLQAEMQCMLCVWRPLPPHMH